MASRIGRSNKERPFSETFAVHNGNSLTDVVNGTAVKLGENKIINLSNRELQVQGLMRAGCRTPKEISEAIFQQTGEVVSPVNVSDIIHRLRKKLA